MIQCMQGLMRRGLIGINIPKGVHMLFEDINPHLVRFLSIVKWAQGPVL